MRDRAIRSRASASAECCFAVLVVLAAGACGRANSEFSRRFDEEDGTLIANGVAQDGDEWFVWIRGDDQRCLSYTGGGGSGGGTCFVAVPDTWAAEAETAAVGEGESIVFGAVDPRAVEVRVIDEGVDARGSIIAAVAGDFAYYVVHVSAAEADLIDAQVLAIGANGDAFGAAGRYVSEGPPTPAVPSDP